MKIIPPRLIEFFTTPYNLDGIGEGGYFDFVMHNLRNPKEIWRHSYTKQLHAEDRFLVASLYSFGSHFRYEYYSFDASVSLIPLQEAYESRLRYEVKMNGVSRSNDSFNSALKRLLDGYLHSSIDSDNRTNIRFINPSITDFLTHYFRESREESWRIIYGCHFIHQLKYCYEQFINHLNGDLYTNESMELVRYATARGKAILPVVHIGSYNEMDEESAYHCEMASLLFKIRYSEDILAYNGPLIAEHLGHIDYGQINGSCYDLLMEIFDETDEGSPAYHFLLDNWDGVLSGLWAHTRHEDELDKIEGLFIRYGKNLRVFMANPRHQQVAKKMLDEYVHEGTSSWISQDEDDLEDEDDLNTLKQTVRELRSGVFERFYLKDTDYDEYYYFSDVSLERSAERRKAKGAVVNLPDKIKEQPAPLRSEEAKRIVDALFVV